MKSLRRSLARVGKRPPITIPSCFQTYPKSLKEIMRILNSSDPNIESLRHRKVDSFTVENAQGLTYAYENIWFLSSEQYIFKCQIEGSDLYGADSLYRLDKRSLHRLVRSVGLDTDDYDHIGDIDYFDGLLFAPVRCTRRDKAHMLLALSRDLQVVGYSTLSRGTSDAWCAINPWNRLLYMSSSRKANFLYTYDASEFYEVLPHPGQWGKSVRAAFLGKRFFFSTKNSGPDEIESVQGAVFSPNGRLYLTWFISHDYVWYNNYLRIYNALTGSRFGEKEYDFEGSMDEIEGLSVHPSGVIYIAVCDNDWPSTDEFEVHAFKYRDLSCPV